jgi:hypothetical protein
MESNGHGRSLVPKGRTPAFDDRIPKRGPDLFIKRMTGGEAKTFTIWGTRIRGMWVHWNPASGKSEPHFEGDCPACKLGHAKRWKGFLHCYCTEDRQECFLELTPTSADAVMAQMADPSALRGSVVRVSRSAAGNGRLKVQMLTPVGDHIQLPREKDPRRSILKLWGVAEEVADTWLGVEEGGEASEEED